MALAFLCSRLRAQDPDFRISDHPVSMFRGFVIDHGLREEASEEARNVARAVQAMHPYIYGQVYPLNWTKVLRDERHPTELPNIESVARRLRYQKLGAICAFYCMASMLVAHHEDDQYETVLMRLLQGHRGRGLRGMKSAGGIPECEGVYGAYRSGYVNDQKRDHPLYNNKVDKSELRRLRRLLLSEFQYQKHEDDDEDVYEGEDADESAYAHPGMQGIDNIENMDLSNVRPLARSASAEMENIEIEDGGLVIYRPLLGFSKDRLIATCLANNIPWWEDKTNHDATLTLRNAVRHLYKDHDLPRALQKPAILDLSRRCARRVQAQEEAANRLLSRAVIRDFQPNVGTAVVQFPACELRPSRRDTRSEERWQARMAQKREIAGVLVQKILALVSPEPAPPSLANLGTAISRLFPSLASPSEARLVSPAKAFNIAGVHLIPTESDPRTWYLTRMPYPANQPLPWFRMPYWSLIRREFHSGELASKTDDYARNLQRWTWSKWMRWQLWDNRYWIRLTHRLPYRVVVQPFAKEHAAALRAQLTPHNRARLETLLRRHAPGKVRYTLPALYLEEPLDLADVRPRPDYPMPGAVPEGTARHGRNASTAAEATASAAAAAGKIQILALPSLDVRVRRLDDWLRYEIRYKMVDRGTLETAGGFASGAFDAARKG